MEKMLKSKKILITGASVRIGRSLALAAAREGAELFLHYNRSAAEAHSLQAEINDLGGKSTLLQADFSSPLDTQNFTDNLFSSHKIDAVVNNASIFSDLGWKETTIENWELHQRINLTAPFLISQAFALHLPDQGTGRIINMLDWRAFRPGPDHLPYTISKAGLAALTKSLAISLGPAIIVNGIALGAILPPTDGNAAENLVETLPIPRWAKLQEVVETMLFLLSGPSYITGEIIHLDGGKHLI
jgi:NAD(P)-dependent dehydrogenase (short-subunit alcohol dehydrogenase family)